MFTVDLYPYIGNYLIKDKNYWKLLVHKPCLWVLTVKLTMIFVRERTLIILLREFSQKQNWPDMMSNDFRKGTVVNHPSSGSFSKPELTRHDVKCFVTFMKNRESDHSWNINYLNAMNINWKAIFINVNDKTRYFWMETLIVSFRPIFIWIRISGVGDERISENCLIVGDNKGF